MVVIGIDPGVSGAIFVIGDGLKRIVDTPVTRYKSGKKHKTEVDAVALAEALAETTGCLTAIRATRDIFAFVENVSARPGQGVVSMFSFGRSFGVVLGVLAGLRITATLVQPAAWKKHFNLLGKDKDASRLLAIKLLGEQGFERKKDNGRAEAALIAIYGIHLVSLDQVTSSGS